MVLVIAGWSLCIPPTQKSKKAKTFCFVQVLIIHQAKAPPQVLMRLGLGFWVWRKNTWIILEWSLCEYDPDTPCLS